MGLSLRWRYGKYHWVTLIMYDFLGPQEWANIPLYEIATWKNGAAFKSTNFSQVGLPVIKIAELKNGITEQTKRTDGRFSDDIFITKGDMVFAWSGSPQTSIDTFIWEGENGWLNQHIFKVVPKDFIGDQFLFFLLKSLRSRFIRIALNKQTTGLGHVTISDLKEMRVGVPHQSEQQSIVKILAPLQEKIENNRRLNETLEEMARAIFKSWFVDFDPVHAKTAGNAPAHMDAETAALFPSSFGDDGLPEGWKWVQIEDIAEQVAMGPFGSNIKVSTFVESGIPVISGKHLNGILLEDNGHNFVTEEHADRLKRSNVYRDDIVFTHAGNVGQVSIIPETSQYERYVLSQRGFYLRCDKTKISPQYVIYFFKSYIGQHKLLANVSSTGVPSIARPASYLKSIELCLPSLPLLNKFDNLASLYHLKMGSNRNEIQTLAALRDTLLPKLMSGEIRIKEAEKQVSEAL